MDFADVLVLNDDEYRVLHQAAETPKKAVSQDQWLDWGDHTIQVDPIGNKQWVHDTHDGHKRTEARGRGYDAAEVSKLVGRQTQGFGLRVDWREWDTAEDLLDIVSTLFRRN